MGLKIGDLFVKLGLKSGTFNKGLNAAEKKTNNFGNGLKKIGGLIAGAFAVSQIVSFGKELVQLGGIAEGVRTAFNRIADDRVLRDLKDATRDTVGELELMKRAVTAYNLGLPVKNLASLFEFATKRAQETGESVDFLVNSIVIGIGRKSPLILDNLGISAIQLRKKLKGVGMETASVATVAKAVGEIAADSMSESGKIIDTNAIKVANLQSKWANLKLELAENPLVNDTVGKALDFLNRQLILLPQNLEISKRALKAVFGADLGEGISAQQRALNERAKIFIERQKESEAAAQRRIATINRLNAALAEQGEHVKTLGELKTETEALTKSIEDYGINQDAELQRTLRQIAANEKLIKQLTTLRSTRGAAPARMTTRGGVPEIGFGFGEGLERTEEHLDNMQSFYDRMSEQLKKFTDDYLSDWDQLGESLDSLIVDGIISVIDEFGQAVEAMFAGDFNIEELGGRLLTTIGQFLGQFGKMLIAYGIAQEAFWTSLGLGPIGAGVAIAAGVALVIIGGAISGMGSSVSRGNLSTGGGSRAINQSFNVISTNAQDKELVATITYNQLNFILKKGNSNLNRF